MSGAAAVEMVSAPPNHSNASIHPYSFTSLESGVPILSNNDPITPLKLSCEPSYKPTMLTVPEPMVASRPISAGAEVVAQLV